MAERIIFANFDLKDFDDNESKFYDLSGEEFGILNEVSETIVLGFENNNLSASKIVFSSNGIDGIGYSENAFNINNINYTNEKIYFVAKIKSIDNYAVPELPIIEIASSDTDSFLQSNPYTISLSCLDINGELVDTVFESNFDIEGNSGGYFKGFAKINNTKEYIKFKARLYTGDDFIEGTSNTFNVYSSSGFIDYRKVNEDYDQTQNYKDLIFQNILLNKENFFDNFLGTMVGNLSSDPNTLGIKTYEKISNYVSNNSDIDFSNLNAFLSMLENLNIEVEEFKALFPPDLGRLVDNLSVNLSKQKGQKNQFAKNFDNKGYERSDVYGVNLGNELDPLNTLLTAGSGTSYIVAKENFSGNYKMLNTNIISAYDPRFVGQTLNFRLSHYNDTWGWGLILPPGLGRRGFLEIQNKDFTFLGLQTDGDRLRIDDYDSVEGNPRFLNRFYTFYDYISTTEDTYFQKFIDFDNPNTKVGNLSSYFDYSKNNGFVDNTVLNLLTQKILL